MKTKLLYLLLLANFSLYSQTNLVPNGDFENWSSSSQPDNWFIYFNGLFSENTTAQNGASSVKMTISSDTFNFINSEYFAVQANKTYRITLYHKVVSGTFSALDFSIYHKHGTFKEEVIKKTDHTFSTTEWRKVEYEYTSTASENIEVDIWTTGTLDSEILIDNISVVDVENVPVQYTLIPDLNFEQKLIDLGHDDIVDGKVLTSKISALTTINLFDSSISDLTGIEDFTALKTLNCAKNNLTSLDISKNINLTELLCRANKLNSLDVSKNINLRALQSNGNFFTSIDVTKNTKLEVLEVAYLNDNTSSSHAAEGKIEAIDLSKNLALTHLNCSDNNLKNLDVSNNILLKHLTCNGTNLSNIDITKNLDLQSLSIAHHTDGSGPTIGSFESIDISKNTKLETLNIAFNKFTQIDISHNLLLQNLDISKNNIASLDISDKTELYSLISSNNNLTSLDVSKNPNLYRLECEANQITSLDVSKNLQLKYLKCKSNKLTSLDVSNNLLLNLLNCDSNNLKTVDVSKNLVLTELACRSNQLTNLDVSKNLVLTQLACGSNQLTSLDVSNNIKLKDLHCGSNKLTSLDVSKNLKLLYLNFSNNLLTSIDISKNLSLSHLTCINNLLTNIDISNHKDVVQVNCNTNKLTYLNLKNGKSYLYTDPSYPNYKNNPDLRCIQVEDAVKANANWKQFKDDTARFSEDCGGPLVLPSNNFNIETKGESCQGESNGEINITATETFAYTATIGSNNYNFTNNKLAVANLAPGNYTVNITIPGETFEQNYNLVIAKGVTITGKSSVSAKKVNVEITEGTAPFTIFVDGAEQFQTYDSNFNVNMSSDAVLEIATSKACEGIFSKKITGLEFNGKLLAYPNPTSGSFEIEIPTNKAEIKIELYNIAGQLISAETYKLEDGKAQLNLSGSAAGLYAAKIYLETPEYLKIIKK